MKLIIIFFTIIAFSSTSSAQELIFAENLGDIIHFMRIDEEDNIYLVGKHEGVKDFDLGPSEFLVGEDGKGYMFFAKYNSNRELLLVTTNEIETGTTLSIDDMNIDHEGNVYIIGLFGGIFDVDPGPEEVLIEQISPGFDMYMMKLNAVGEFEWKYTLINGHMNRGFSVVCDSENNVYLSGDFAKTIDFDPGPGVFELDPVSLGSDQDGFLAKLTSSGEFIWAKRIACTASIEEELINQLYCSSNDEIYFNGDFDGPVIFEGVELVEEESPLNQVLVKLNSDGEYIWHHGLGDGGNIYYGDIVVNEENEVFCTGNYSGNLKIQISGVEITQPIEYGLEYFVAKFNEFGELDWFNSFPGESNHDAGQSIFIGKYGRVYTAGKFGEEIDFNSGPEEAIREVVGSHDIFVHCLDAEGEFISIMTIGQFTEDQANSVVVNSDGNLFVTGRFRGVCDMDPSGEVYNLISTGGSDGFFLEFLEDCDALNSELELDGFSLISTVADVEYQWLDCEDDYSVIIGETSQIFEATENGSYSVMITSNDCVDTSECIIIEGITVSELSESSEDSFVEIYPNPFDDYTTIYFSGKTSGIYQLIIYNSIGQEIYHIENLDENQFSIHKRDLGLGIFYLSLIQEENVVYTKKLIVK